MTAYAIFVTFALGALCGVVATVLTAEWLEKREIAAQTAQQKKSDSDAMDEAVRVVNEHLGASTILTYDNK